ncbi:hypothetical protein Scep_001227 [Stephania cephalantha]|uniref:Uncharacterized protein n=1 Tax=Stephania cephalantha TaxID=152367 RepID=A0AAP0L7Z8_9MAGN
MIVGSAGAAGKAGSGGSRTVFDVKWTTQISGSRYLSSTNGSDVSQIPNEQTPLGYEL